MAAQPQKLFGGLIGGLVAKKGLELAVNAVVKKIAANDDNTLHPSEAPEVAKEITKAVEKEVVSQVKNITNTEDHWYQKRSFWSAIVSILMVVLAPWLPKLGLDLSPAMQEYVTTILTTVGGLWASYLAVRAGTATKPLGE